MRRSKPQTALLQIVATLALLIQLTLVSSTVTASDEVVNFDNPAHKQMYQAVLKAYRCLKCQNQNLWDSNASLAGDLRREIRAQIIDGKSREDIDEYLVARYGEFVLYKPRFSAKTAILWIGPFVLLFIGLATLFLMVRGKKNGRDESAEGGHIAPPPESYSSDKLAKAQALLKD
ncbi:cytochrome c-type biogenesis protein CcmH [Granulosicoccus sp.]|nr:cytochrome c-type biogenesis protein CcmH [Granulosicoccus sp.]